MKNEKLLFELRLRLLNEEGIVYLFTNIVEV